MKKKYSLNMVLNNCKDKEEKSIIKKSLSSAIAMYQWQYQTAIDENIQKYDSVKKKSITCIDHVIELLIHQGQNTLAEDVEHALHIREITKQKVLSEAKQFLKEYVLNQLNRTSLVSDIFTKTLVTPPNTVSKISKSRYEKEFAFFLGEAFKEHCDENPLEEAPLPLDNSWTPL